MRRERFFRPQKDPPCTCTHPHSFHNLLVGCYVQDCSCLKFQRGKLANKYGARSEEAKGIHYDSKLESKVGTDLLYQLQAGDIKELDRQHRFELVVNGLKICEYIADFLVTHTDGSLEVIEAKGIMFPLSRLKLKLFEACYPDIRLTVVR